VSAVVDWSGARVSDPAEDLAWLAVGADPEALAVVVAEYATARGGGLDPHLVDRAVLHGEMALVTWLLHGARTGDDGIVADAGEMLRRLATWHDEHGDGPTPQPTGHLAASGPTTSTAAAGVATAGVATAGIATAAEDDAVPAARDAGHPAPAPDGSAGPVVIDLRDESGDRPAPAPDVEPDVEPGDDEPGDEPGGAAGDDGAEDTWGDWDDWDEEPAAGSAS
jgi:hypothetical protein